MTPEELEALLEAELPSNGRRQIKASHIRGLLSKIYLALKEEIGQSVVFKNIEVNDLHNESLLNHGLDTQKLEIGFYGADGRPVSFYVDWQPIDNDTIRVYLPLGIGSFTGEVFIRKRG